MAIVIADARETGCPLVDVNPAFERLTGYSFSEIKGQNCRFLQGPRTDPTVVAAMRHAIAEERDFATVVLNYRKDGTPFWNEMSFSPVHDRDGHLTHFLGIQRDVTEREQSTRQLELLADISRIIGRREQPEETVRAMAQATVPGFADLCTVHLAVPEALPRWIGTFGIDEDLVRLTTELEDGARTNQGATGASRAVLLPSHPVMESTRSPSAMLDAVAIDGRHRERLARLGLCAVLMVPIMADDIVFGTFQLLRFDPELPFSPTEIDLARDVAGRAGAVLEQARLLERAQTAIASRDRFLSIAAHEMRTPVTTLKGYAQLLSRNVQRRSLSMERLHLALRAIESSVSRLSTLTDDLIGMAHRELRELPLRKTVIDVPSFLCSVVDQSRSLLDHPVHLDPGTANVEILGDVAMLEQVVMNLIENAARYSPASSPIEITATTRAANVIVSVKDQGVGVIGTELERMFEPFARGDDDITADLAGLGLGLFISKGNIERHGGRIWAESAGRNQGTTVCFALPIHPFPDA